MAGPYTLAPGASKGGIPTWGFGRHTKVTIDSYGEGGKVAFKAGGSASESNYLRNGRNEYSRNFGGVYLTITNEGSTTIKAWTE